MERFQSEDKETTLIYEVFDSITDLLEETDLRQVNPIFHNRELTSQEAGRADWFGTDTYQAARELLNYGDQYYYEKLIEENKKIEKKIQSFFSNISNQSIIVNQPVGFVPHIPNAIQNLPNSMIDRVMQPKKRKTITIIYNDAINGGTNHEVIVQAGICLLNVINALEKQGVTVRIYGTFFSSVCGSEAVWGMLRLKDYNERLSLKKLAFPLVNPAMFRRIGFKWMETQPAITEKRFSNGYGSAKDVNYFIENYPSAFPVDGTYYTDAKIIEKEYDYSVEKLFEDIKERCANK